jgi:hypothetical protein
VLNCEEFVDEVPPPWTPSFGPGHPRHRCQHAADMPCVERTCRRVGNREHRPGEADRHHGRRRASRQRPAMLAATRSRATLNARSSRRFLTFGEPPRQVGMTGMDPGGPGLVERLRVRSVARDGLDRTVGQCPGGQRPDSRCLLAAGAIAVGAADDAQTGPIALLGWGRAARIASHNDAVAGPVVPAQAVTRDGVHSACRRWASGLWPRSMVCCPRAWLHRCGATADSGNCVQRFLFRFLLGSRSPRSTSPPTGHRPGRAPAWPSWGRTVVHSSEARAASAARSARSPQCSWCASSSSDAVRKETTS